MEKAGEVSSLWDLRMKAGADEDVWHCYCNWMWFVSEQFDVCRKNMLGHVTEQSHGSVRDDDDLGLWSDLSLK